MIIRMNKELRDYVEDFARIHEARGLTRTKGRILSYLTVSNPIIQSLDNICQALDLAKSTVSPELKQLVTNIAVHYGLVVEGYTGMTIVVEDIQDTDDTQTPTETQTDGFADGVAVAPPVFDVTSIIGESGNEQVSTLQESQGPDSDDEALNGFPLILGTFAIFAFAFIRRKHFNR